MVRKLAVSLLIGIPVGIGAAPAGAQATPATDSSAPASPEATKAALLAFGLIVADVHYEPNGTDGTVAVTLFGPPHPEMPDQIFAVVWAAEPLRFSDVVVRWPSGQAVRTYGELLAERGPRPAGFDQTTVLLTLLFGNGEFSFDFDGFGLYLAVIAIVIVIGVTLIAVLVVGLVLAFVVHRRRRLTTVS